MKYHYKKNISGKYIVFDVDETLGYFSQLGSFMDAISFYYKDYSGSIFERFNQILDLFPEFVRPKMIEILKYVYKKKVNGICDGVFIYTNNQGPRTWVQHIAKYFDYKVGNVEKNEGENESHRGNLFDKIIAAYIINGKVIEPGRTSQNKTYDDLLRVTRISPHAEVCFVDDLNHPEMRHENVLYLNVKPYVKTLPVNEMIQRYLKSPLASTIVDTREFISAIRVRMGAMKNANHVHRLDLHDSNYISLQTPFDSASLREDAEYKHSGDKLFNYIKLFFKIKQHSKRGTKLHSLHTSSQTRRRRHNRHHNSFNDQNQSNSDIGVSFPTHSGQTRKHILIKRKRSHSKTRRNGAVIMRI